MRYNRYRYQPDGSSYLGGQFGNWMCEPVGRSITMESNGGPYTSDNPPSQIIVQITHLEVAFPSGEIVPGIANGTHVLLPPDYTLIFEADTNQASAGGGVFRGRVTIVATLQTSRGRLQPVTEPTTRVGVAFQIPGSGASASAFMFKDCAGEVVDYRSNPAIGNPANPFDIDDFQIIPG